MVRKRNRPTVDEGRPAAPVTIRGVSKSYRSGASRLQALVEIDLVLEPRTFTAIMGPSGSGKTTLLHCLLGLDKPDSGAIFVGGTDITGLDETSLAKLRRSRLGVVFQSYNLIPALTAADNISLPLRLAGEKIDPATVQRLADAVGVGGFLDHRPAQLSGGQQQRVAFARALIADPDLVVADEPTGALDSATAEAVLGLLRSIVRDLGQQVLMVTHDPVAASAADRVLFMADGRWQGELRGASATQIAAAVAELGRHR
ncbi:ABC transporter ATP-binding protein [Natronosporangium hydrolyticum]|uniref:ABC transporter ATP-binding protein n=1 Tax=Natronosporangium hydrolyticum TaxID=2811111 RepID=A0A895YDF0_9ACTN|nr:ABC transporter ATP-binding protein [Natronosporangium hydrolyticum]QSB14202.1 ABC transporter ATP-binding protein [Natronosporangium hydrolyticum]